MSWFPQGWAHHTGEIYFGGRLIKKEVPARNKT